MSVQMHLQLAHASTHRRAREKTLKTHLRRVGIAVALLVVALIVMSLLPTGVHASAPRTTPRVHVVPHLSRMTTTLERAHMR